jgi:predicted permease
MVKPMREAGDWRDLWRRLLPWRQARVDVDDEIAFHIEEQVEALVELGVPEREARARALRDFGDIQTARAQMSALAGARVSRLRLENLMDGTWRDIKLTARGLTHRPTFAGVVILTLALGIGANTAVFSVLNSILLRPLPFHEPNRIVRIYEEVHVPNGERIFPHGPLTAPAFVDLRQASSLFEEVAAFSAYREFGSDLTGGEVPERVVRMPISSEFFHVLGISPLLGRSFTLEEERGGVRLAVISHALWRRHFGGIRDVLGASLELDGVTFEVIGVMPQGFRGPLGTAVEVWTPTDLSPEAGGFNRGNHYLSAVGRLADDVTFEQVRAGIESYSRAIAEEEGRIYDGAYWTAVAVQLHEDRVGGTRATLWVLMAAVALVLLSTCVNVANLFLVRSFSRTKELAIRASLGCGRGGLVRVLVNETMLLSLLGGGLGLFLAWAGIRGLLRWGPAGLPRAEEIGVDPTVLLFTLAVSVLTGLVLSLTPVLRTSRQDLARDLRERGRVGSGGTSFRRLRSVLVVAEVAVALVLLVGAGTLMRSFQTIRAVDLKVETEGILTYEVHLPTSRYPDGQSREAFYQEFFPRVASLTGVGAVGAISWLPINGGYNNWGTTRPDVPEDSEYRGMQADVRVVAGDFFGALDVDLVSGRYLDASDDPRNRNAVVVNELFRDRLFEGGEALGKLIRVGGAEWVVVGVVENVPSDAFGEVAPKVYIPHAQFADDRNWALTQTLSYQGDLGVLTSRLRQELGAVDPNLVLFRVQTLEDVLGAALIQQRFSLLLMEAFAGLALLLAVIGIYGVLSYLVSQRRHEIGVRIALGAGTGTVRRMVMREGMVLSGIGVTLGLGLALYLSRWLQALVFEVEVVDPWLFGAVALCLAGVAGAASYLPARQATRVDPAAAFREE